MKLLSVIGDDIGQIVPILHTYRDMFSEYVLVCDALSRPNAQRLAHGMRRYSSHYHLSWRVTIQAIDADDLSGSITQLLSTIEDMSEVWLDVTDAYPMLSLLLGKEVERGGGTVISYDHYADKIHLLTPHAHSLTCSKPNPPMTVYFTQPFHLFHFYASTFFTNETDC